MMPVRPLIHLFICLLFVLPVTAQTAELAKSPDRTQGPMLSRTAANVSSQASTTGTHDGIPFKQEKHSTGTLAYQSFAALILVGLIAYGIAYGLKRFGGGSGGVLRKSRRVRTIESIRLGRRSMLHVVEYGGQELLLSESEHDIHLLISGPLAAQSPLPEKGAVDA